ncbi:hypothetical protein ACFLU4_07530 [Chloroflexota bacterium]
MHSLTGSTNDNNTITASSPDPIAPSFEARRVVATSHALAIPMHEVPGCINPEVVLPGAPEVKTFAPNPRVKYINLVRPICAVIPDYVSFMIGSIYIGLAKSPYTIKAFTGRASVTNPTI